MSNIRWRDKDKTELKRVIKNFNAKIDRQIKKDPKNQRIMPEKVKFSDLEKFIETRNDYKSEIEMMKRFTKRGAEKPVDIPTGVTMVTTTQWQKSEMERMTRKANKEREKNRQAVLNTELESRGEKLGYTRGQIGMGRMNELSYKPITTFPKSMTRTSMEKKFRLLKAETKENFNSNKMALLKENYKKSLMNGMPTAEWGEVFQKIDGMTEKEFFAKFLKEDLNIFENYIMTDDEFNTQFEMTKEIWLG